MVRVFPVDDGGYSGPCAGIKCYSVFVEIQHELLAKAVGQKETDQFVFRQKQQKLS